MQRPARHGVITRYGDDEEFLGEIARVYGDATAAAVRASIAEARARHESVEGRIARIEARQRAIRQRMDELVTEFPALKSRP